MGGLGFIGGTCDIVYCKLWQKKYVFWGLLVMLIICMSGHGNNHALAHAFGYTLDLGIGFGFG